MILTLGELMMRLAPPDRRRLVQANSLDLTFGGAEANVAVSLACLGRESLFVSKLPAHPLGQAALNYLRQTGVNTAHVRRGDGRLGLYFLEPGAGPRSSNVIYDRARSAFATLRPDDTDWNALAQRARWLHWSGITPALGDGPLRCVRAACQAAQSAGVPVSCDLNFRRKLWSPEQARATMGPLMQYVDLCIAGRGDAQTMLGVEPPRSDRGETEVDEALYAELAEAVKAEHGFAAVAITLRESHSASRHGWSALLLDEDDCAAPYRSRRYDLELVDRVGGGDAFAAGLIDGLLTYSDARDALDFAAAAAALKHSIPGDANWATRQEVEQLAFGPDGRRVNR